MKDPLIAFAAIIFLQLATRHSLLLLLGICLLGIVGLLGLHPNMERD